MRKLGHLYLLELIFTIVGIVQFVISVVFVYKYLPLYNQWIAEPLDAGLVETSHETPIRAVFLIPMVLFIIISIISIIAPALVFCTAAQKTRCKCILYLFSVVVGLAALVFVGLSIGARVAEDKFQPETEFKQMNISQWIVRVGFEHHPEGFKAAKEDILKKLDKSIFTETHMGIRIKEGIVEWASVKLTNLWNKIQTEHHCCGDDTFEDYQMSLWYLYWGTKVAKAVPKSCCSTSEAAVCGLQDQTKATIINQLATGNVSFDKLLGDMKKTVAGKGAGRANMSTASGAPIANLADMIELYNTLSKDPEMKKSIELLKNDIVQIKNNPTISNINDAFADAQPRLQEINAKLNVTTAEGLEAINKTGCKEYFEDWVMGLWGFLKKIFIFEACWLMLMTMFILYFACKNLPSNSKAV